VKRGKACDTCGIVEPHHRPECAGMKADDAEAEEAFAVLGADLASLGTVERVSIEETGEDPAESYDRNDTAAVAAHIDGMTRPNDAPLTPVGEDTKPLVKLPKRAEEGGERGGGVVVNAHQRALDQVGLHEALGLDPRVAVNIAQHGREQLQLRNSLQIVSVLASSLSIRRRLVHDRHRNVQSLGAAETVPEVRPQP
jgi:hypothetical protein